MTTLPCVNELQSAWGQHLATPFPHGTEMVGQLALNDGHVAGLVSSYLKAPGQLDSWRLSLVDDLERRLAELWEGLELAVAEHVIPTHWLVACREYIGHLDHLARLLMRCAAIEREY